MFLSYTEPVCQLGGHQKGICPIFIVCPVFTVGEKVMVPLKAKEKSNSPV